MASWRHSTRVTTQNLGSLPGTLPETAWSMIRGRGREAGVEVEYRDCEGMIHSFFTMVPAIDGAVRAQTFTCEAKQRAFAQVA